MLTLNSAWPQSGDGPLHIAVWYNHSDVVSSLLNFDQTNVSQPNHNGVTPLITAAQLGLDEIVNMLQYKGKTVFEYRCT